LLIDHKGRFKERYDALHGTAYLVRPDQHVASRWRTPSRAGLVAALAQATCN
jgi:3-(3-hydroxy-phenyl)propionate hydroxylase